MNRKNFVDLSNKINKKIPDIKVNLKIKFNIKIKI